MKKFKLTGKAFKARVLKYFIETHIDPIWGSVIPREIALWQDSMHRREWKKIMKCRHIRSKSSMPPLQTVAHYQKTDKLFLDRLYSGIRQYPTEE